MLVITAITFLGVVNIDIIFPNQGNHGHEIPNQGNHAHGVNTGGSHSHGGAVSNAGGHGHNLGNAGAHNHNVAVTSTGESGTNKNLPPYMGLFYIIRIK